MLRRKLSSRTSTMSRVSSSPKWRSKCVDGLTREILRFLDFEKSCSNRMSTRGLRSKNLEVRTEVNLN